MISFTREDRKALLDGLGMRSDGAGGFKFDNGPRLPLPLPKKIEKVLQNARTIALRDALDPAAKAARQAIEKSYEEPSPFAPSAERVQDEEEGDPEEGISVRPQFRNWEWNKHKTTPFWPGVEHVIRRNRRVKSFVDIWGNILPLFEAQYAEYLINPVMDLPEAPDLSVTAMLLAPDAVAATLPRLGTDDLKLTAADRKIHAVALALQPETHLDMAAGLLDRARQLQNERENKAASAANLALDLIQFLVEDKRQRLDIASGVTVAPLIEAHCTAEALRNEAEGLEIQRERLNNLASGWLKEALPNASTRLAYAGAYMQTDKFGPSITALDGQARERGQEIMEAAKQLATLTWEQQQAQLYAQSVEVSARATAAKLRFQAHGERAAAAAQGAFRTLNRVNESARIVAGKVVLACTSGGALNYAQQEQQVRKEYLSALRRALLRLGDAQRSLVLVYGYDVSAPAEVEVALRVANGASVPEQEPSLPQVVAAALQWARDASEWLMRTRRSENRWTRAISLRQLVTDDRWADMVKDGAVSFTITAEELGARMCPRLQGIALEASVRDRGDAGPAQTWNAAITLPPVGTFRHRDNEQQFDQSGFHRLPLGRIRPGHAIREAPAPDLTERVLNASPLGSWEVSFTAAEGLEDAILHLWLAEVSHV